MILTNQVKYRSGQIKEGFMPYFSGANGRISIDVKFVPEEKQWYLLVSKLEKFAGSYAYIRDQILKISVKQAGAILKGNKLHIWSKDGYSKSIDKRLNSR